MGTLKMRDNTTPYNKGNIKSTNQEEIAFAIMFICPTAK